MSEMLTALARFVGRCTIASSAPVVSTPELGIVDVHFFRVGFTDEAADKDRFLTLLAAALNGPGEFVEVDAKRLAQGPSYIELGAWIGSQDLALRLMALGERHELWTVVTPEKLGITDPKVAAERAGLGLVMISPSPGLVETILETIQAHLPTDEGEPDHG